LLPLNPNNYLAVLRACPRAGGQFPTIFTTVSVARAASLNQAVTSPTGKAVTQPASRLYPASRWIIQVNNTGVMYPPAIGLPGYGSREHSTTRDTRKYSARGDLGSIDVDVFSKEIIKRSLVRL
jgi:hypothetical protein